MKKGEKRQEEILSCAEIIFSQKGYYEAHVSDIVEMAHIAKGTIYQYFSNKEDIFLALLRRYVHEWKEEVTVNINNYSADNPSEEIAHMYIKYRVGKTLHYFDKNQHRCNIVLRMGVGLNPIIENAINSFEDEIMQLIKKDFEMAKRNGHISGEKDIEIICTAIMGAILRIGYHYFVRKKGKYQTLNLEELEEVMVKFIEDSMNMYQRD